MRRTIVLLSAGLLAFSMAVPGAVMAAPGHYYLVSKPNGTDDTANIQAGLDWCAAHGPDCTVQLRAGTYKTSQLVEDDFQGTLMGAGEYRTTIQALQGLTGTPNLITFEDGNIEISDLTISEPWGNGTATSGLATTYLWSAVCFEGSPAELSVDRVSITGATDPTSGSQLGYNLEDGVEYWGSAASASLSVRSSVFTTMYVGVEVGQNSGSARVTIGGSPWSGNYFANDPETVDLASRQSSVFDVSYNTAAKTTERGVEVDWGGPGCSLSKYFIHDNWLTGVGPAAYAIFVGGNSIYAPCIAATIWENTINVLPVAGLGGTGIGVYYIKNAVIMGNTITGAGQHAIQLYGVTNSMVQANDLSRFTPTSGDAQIYLATDTHQDTVVCLHHRDTVHNGGTGNTIIGCNH